MALKLMREGKDFSPRTDSENILQDFCAQTGLQCTLEWIDGQYWIHSDRDEENPFTIHIDAEIERHLVYFRKSSLQKELLARAIGIKGPYRPRVLDLSAGLLGDTLMFLSFGCQVYAVERHPMVALVIESALKNATHPLAAQLHFSRRDALDILSDAPEVDVLYYDPMYEDPNRRTSPQKEMRLFRHFVGSDADAELVFAAARKKGLKRLVVKRPRLSGSIGDDKALVYEGKSTRYDVYLGLS
jgi:16S rRNA (guanine1516-N2)-methyltransferase